MGLGRSLFAGVARVALPVSGIVGPATVDGVWLRGSRVAARVRGVRLPILRIWGSALVLA